jgi:hypothetical protein
MPWRCIGHGGRPSLDKRSIGNIADLLHRSPAGSKGWRTIPFSSAAIPAEPLRISAFIVLLP